MNPIIEHFQTNIAVYLVGVLAVLPPVFYFRKKTFPVIYHTLEYLIYCLVTHVVLGGGTRLFSWFRSETAFKNMDGSMSKDFAPYTTPLNLNFWEKSLYSPSWLFYFEIALACALLYLVIFVRPTSYRKRNWVVSNAKNTGAKGKSKSRYDRKQASQTHSKA